ncbi:anthranilate phosphoribosyltransferase [Savitreella phatthalungensis]
MDEFLREPRASVSLITRCFEEIVSGDQLPDYETTVRAFLTRLHETSLDRDPEVLSAAASVLRCAANRWPISTNPKPTDPGTTVVDIVGTGGDGHNTYNVSTTAAIVCAGHPAIKVIKHGNKASTSASGSADILRSYGCELMLTPSALVADVGGSGESLVDRCPFVFLLAPMWHPAMLRVAPIRKSLTHPTIFNLLGPLLNPAPIHARIIGVHSANLGHTFCNAFALLQPEGRCMIVCGRTGDAAGGDGVGRGLDEISPAGVTDTWTYTPEDGVVKGDLHPERDFGISLHRLEDVRSGTPEENARTLGEILGGGGGGRIRGDPVYDYVLLNAAALVVLARAETDYKAAVAAAETAITSGRAKAALDLFRDTSRALAGHTTTTITT